MTAPARIALVLGPTLAAVMATAAAAQAPAAVERGEAVFEYWCATCHGAGPGMPGTAALRAKYGGKVPAPLADRTDLTPGSIRFFVRSGVSIMPFFRKTEVGDADLEALIAYLTRPRSKREEPQAR